MIREQEDLHISTIIKAHKHNETTLADLGVAKVRVRLTVPRVY
jgi:hypothetical protein